MWLWQRALGAVALGILLMGGKPMMAAAADGPAITIRSSNATEYFELDGKSQRAVWKQLSSADNPLTALYPTGTTALGHARVDYHYRYQPAFGSSASLCRIASADIELHFTTTLPRLADGPVPELLARQWPRFEAAIAGHEAGHHAIYRDLETRIPQVLENFGEAPCSELDQRLQVAINDVVQTVRRRSREYDELHSGGSYLASAL